LLRAADFNSRTSVLVQGRRFEFFLAIYGSPILKRALIAGSASKRKFSPTMIFGNVVNVEKNGRCSGAPFCTLRHDLPRYCHFLIVFQIVLNFSVVSQ
jgi:hypothetical protein